jgi:hypothetical protein
MSRFPLFDIRQIRLADATCRGSDLRAEHCAKLEPPQPPFDSIELSQLAESIRTAKRNGRPVIVMLGGHPIKLGLSPFVIDLMRLGYITHVATNGAGLIHDFELSLLGETSEDVSKWIRVGQFGLWQQTSQLNDVIRQAADRGLGFGEAVGELVEEGEFPHRNLSIAAAGWRYRVPVTGHVGVGSDIIHAMPNCDGAAVGKTSYTDFLMFAESIRQLEGGVFLNIGSAVAGPEVYLKALSMARNLATQKGAEIRQFTTGVFDLIPLPVDWRQGPPSKDHPGYYFRPWKTILIRTVADGGRSFYVCGDHRETISTLWNLLTTTTPDSLSF